MVDALRRPLLVVAALLCIAGGLAAASAEPGAAERRVAVGTRGMPDREQTLTLAPPDSLPIDGPSTSTTSAPADSTTTTRAPRSSSTTRPDEVPEAVPTPSAPAPTEPTAPTEDPDDPSGPSIVRGRVLDEAGQPIAGVCIQPSVPGGPEDAPARVVSDAQGRYRIVGDFFLASVYVCDPTRYEFSYLHDGALVRQHLGPGTVTHDIRMVQLAGLRGRVVDQQGRPLAGVLVYVCCAEFPAHPVTGPDGRFELPNVNRGRQGVTLHYRGEGPPREPLYFPASVTIEPGRWNDVTLVAGPWV